MRKLFFFIFLFSLFPLISANGLQLGNQTFNVSKTIDNDVSIVFTIFNTDSITFYNITFETNDIINMTKVPQLNSGQAINVTATIKTNEDFNGSIRVIGFYEAKLGTSNLTKEISVGYNEGIVPCETSIIKGDSVKWNNNANRNIVMKNSESGSDITSLTSNSNYTQQFNEPLSLNYYFTWLGFKFTPICTLTVLNDIGYINNPEYDAKLNVSVDVNYEPTTLQATFLETNYTVVVYTSEEGMFLVKNVGPKVAKRVHISNPWFKFTPNDFDLEPNSSKTIGFVIDPIIQKTNDTGKNWEQTIVISGNFENINQIMNVYVPYADIDSGNYSSGDSIISLILKFCTENPNEPICKANPTVIFKNGSGGDNLTQEQFREILEYQYTIFQGMIEQNTWEKEVMYEMSQNITQIAIDNNVTRTEVEKIKTENQGVVGTLYFIILGVCIFIIVGGGSYLIWYFRQQKKTKELRRW